jgi:hypothetical protein
MKYKRLALLRPRDMLLDKGIYGGLDSFFATAPTYLQSLTLVPFDLEALLSIIEFLADF